MKIPRIVKVIPSGRPGCDDPEISTNIPSKRSSVSFSVTVSFDDLKISKSGGEVKKNDLILVRNRDAGYLRDITICLQGHDLSRLTWTLPTT